MPELILFGAGAALIVDYEETCHRLGIAIAAIVQNRDGEIFGSNRSKVVRVDQLDAAMLRVPCLCPIFDSAARQTASGEASALGLQAHPTLIDPTSPVASTSTFGPGGYVNAGCVVGAASQIGSHVVINRGAGIGHHSRIGDFVSIGPGVVVAGFASIGEGATIGAGAVIAPRIRIGAWAVIGAGSVVTKDVPDHFTVVGNPARPLHRKSRTSDTLE